ncbi:hypothetical protein BC834DRAFT_170940 [Gloeopeniophorella convolvens]|nr:hypothetical protein BC834DRAFT_170940 [Gloeopeniophorella convolvens]
MSQAICGARYVSFGASARSDEESPTHRCAAYLVEHRSPPRTTLQKACGPLHRLKTLNVWGRPQLAIEFCTSSSASNLYPRARLHWSQQVVPFDAELDSIVERGRGLVHWKPALLLNFGSAAIVVSRRRSALRAIHFSESLTNSSSCLSLFVTMPKDLNILGLVVQERILLHRISLPD